MDRISKSFISPIKTKQTQLDPGFWSRTSQIQLMYGAWVNMAQFAIGLGFGFATVQVPQLLSSVSEIPITRNDASWIEVLITLPALRYLFFKYRSVMLRWSLFWPRTASMLLLSYPVGCMTSGLVMDRFGRRIMLIISQVVMFIGWLYTSFANNPIHLIIARAITGVGCGMAASPSRIYCTEISLPNIRGVLGAFPNISHSVGMTVQAALGKFFHWKLLCYVCCVFTLVISWTFTMLPESPYFILQTKSMEDARANLANFRGPTYDIDIEMDQLRDFKQYNNIRKLTFIENMRALFNKASCKPFWLIMGYALIGQLAGCSVVMFWSVELLEEANSSFDVYDGNILLALTRVFTGGITSVLLYKVGKRPLALISAIGVILVCFTVGVFLINYDEPSVFPLICFILYNVFACLGYYSLPHLMAYELLPLQVRGILGGILVSLHSVMMFASTNLEPFVLDHLGVGNTFVAFGGFSLLGAVYLYFYLPETKDLTLQEIEEYYKEIRPTLISQRRIRSMNSSVIQTSPQSSSLKLNRDAPRLMTSKKSMLAKLEAKRQLNKLEQGASRTELESNKSKKSTVSIKSMDSIKSTDLTKSTESKKSTDNIKSTDSKISMDSKKSMDSKISMDGKKSMDSKISMDGKKSMESKISINSKKSTDSKKSLVRFDENVDNDKDLEKIKSTESTDNKKSRQDGKSKEPKESSQDGENTPIDKDQASTSKKNT